MNKLNLRKNTKLLAIFLSVLLVSACYERPTDQKRIDAGELRRELFKECMSFSASNGRKGDDDVSDIVESCDSYAYYTSNQIVDY